MNDILNAREMRSNIINDYLTNNFLVTIKANIPGINKNINSAYFLVNLFKNIIQDQYELEHVMFYESLDGCFYLVEINQRYSNIKEMMICIEETHELGRLIDIDVYYQKQPIKRVDLNKEFRQCLMCNDFAIVCMRNQTHSISEVLETIELMILNYLKKELRILVDQAITLEAKLDPKFGLVTFNSKGSHQDMDYSLLERSKLAILDDFVEMFECGYQNNLDDAYKFAREIGKHAEIKMMEATKGVNTYKGLIFVLGFVIIAVGRCFRENKYNLYQNVKYMGKDLLDEFDLDTDETFGKKAYQRYHMFGVRGEVHQGLINVQRVIDKINDFKDETLLMCLINLISNVEDTVLLKRAGSIEKYKYYQTLFQSIKHYDYNQIEQLTQNCIKDNISFGGSADLLVVAIFIRKVEERFKINYEKI